MRTVLCSCGGRLRRQLWPTLAFGVVCRRCGAWFSRDEYRRARLGDLRPEADVAP